MKVEEEEGDVDLPSLEDEGSKTDIRAQSASKVTVKSDTGESGRDALARRLKELLKPSADDPEKPRGTAEEKKKRNMWKQVVRLRLLSNLILSCMKTTALEDYLPEVTIEEGDIPVFKVTDYKRTYKTVELSSKVKTILMKPLEFRTSDEIEIVKQNFKSLPFFQKYSPDTHYELAQALTYQWVPANRLIVKQGHRPVCFYFIISGGLAAQVLEKDVDTGFERERVLGELKPGITFGEIALIHNTRRTASVFTKYNSELLFLFKEDFDNILRSNEKNIWFARYNFIKNMKCFINWTEEDVQDFSNNCKTQKYEDNKVIIGNLKDFRCDHLYFIIEGECKVIEILRLVQVRTTVTTFYMPPISMSSNALESTIKPPATLVKRLLNILTLKRGQYFGSGEDLRQRYIVASGKTEVISIPYVYLQRHNHLTWLEILQDSLQGILPTHYNVFEEFIQRVVWRSYRHKVFSDIEAAHDKHFYKAQESDVPVSIRRKDKMEKWTLVQN